MKGRAESVGFLKCSYIVLGREHLVMPIRVVITLS